MDTKKFFLLMLLITSVLSARILHANDEIYNFDEWYSTCAKLPYNRDIGENYSHKPKKLDEAEIETTLTKFKEASLRSFGDKSHWVNEKAPGNDFYKNPVFKPFAQKVEIPQGAQAIFHGDLHGDVHALNEQIKHFKDLGHIDNNFKITNQNIYFVYLGDYVDRGNYGMEVIYTLMRFKIANPRQVIMVRGNHEDASVNYFYGFAQELQQKFPGQPHELLAKVSKIYDLLPVVAYIGTNHNYLQCNHGGMELGYMPHNLLNSEKSSCFEEIQELSRKSNVKKYFDQCYCQAFEKEISDLAQTKKINLEGSMKYKDFIPQDCYDIGFLWNDFIVKNGDRGIDYQKDRGWIFGNKATEKTLQASSNEKNKIIAVMRAHQHGDGEMMHKILEGKTPGVAKLWNEEKNQEIWEGMVATFNVSPDTSYGKNLKFNDDAFGIVTLGKNFPKDWSFKVDRLNVVPKNR